VGSATATGGSYPVYGVTGNSYIRPARQRRSDCRRAVSNRGDVPAQINASNRRIRRDEASSSGGGGGGQVASFEIDGFMFSVLNLAGVMKAGRIFQ
jgi:hypothetical protein